MPKDLNCGLACKQHTGETTWQAFALFVQVATQVVQVHMVREGGLAKLCNIATRKAFLDIRQGGESQECYNSYTQHSTQYLNGIQPQATR